MKTEDVTYFLNGSFEKDPLFKRYKEMIEIRGSIQVKDENKKVRIYNPYLFLMLTTKELPVHNLETKKDVTINGFDYLKTFIQGYIEGEKYFIREFEVSPDTRYKNPQYVKDIYLNYFHGKGIEGWEAVKRSHPLTFNHESIKKFGFDSGIVCKVEELIEKSPALFENFDNHKKVTGKPKIFFRRIYSFILAEAYHRGESTIKDCSVNDFCNILKVKFNINKPRSIYQTVRSNYKNDKNFLFYFDDMKKLHSKDYEYAMKIFKDYYPNLPEIKFK